MTEYITILLEIIVSVAVALIVRYAIPYLKALTESEKYEDLIKIIAVAVKAAEQTIKERGQGKAKKAEVIAFVSHWLKSRGIHLTEDALDKLIEAAVFAMKQESNL